MLALPVDNGDGVSRVPALSARGSMDVELLKDLEDCSGVCGEVVDIGCPGYAASWSKSSNSSSVGSMRQILTVWSAEHVARKRISGERRRRVRYSL